MRERTGIGARCRTGRAAVHLSEPEGAAPGPIPSEVEQPQGKPRYVERDLLDPTPARLRPLDFSSGSGYLSSPDPADHEPWDRPLFRRVIVRPAERLASRFALISPRPLLIGLIAILAKEIATRQIETDLLNTPDDAVWKPGAMGIVRQAQANLDRRIKMIVRKGYRAMLDDELRAVREDPIGAILYNNLLGEAGAIFSRQVSNVTMELASSIEDQVIESLELIGTGLPDDEALGGAEGLRDGAALTIGAAGADGAPGGAPGRGGADGEAPWHRRWRLRLTVQPRPVQLRVPPRPVVGFGEAAAGSTALTEIERVVADSGAVSGPAIALRAARVGASSAAREWEAWSAEVGARNDTAHAAAGGAWAPAAREQHGAPQPQPRGEAAAAAAARPGATDAADAPLPTGRERVRTLWRRARSGVSTGLAAALADVKLAATSAAAALPRTGLGGLASSIGGALASVRDGVGSSLGSLGGVQLNVVQAQPPPILSAPQEAVRSRLRKLLARVDALVQRLDLDGNEQLTLDELLALLAGSGQPDPLPLLGGAEPAAPFAPAAGAAAEGARLSPAAVAWAEGLDAATLAAIRSTVLIKSTSRARNMWERLQAIAMAPVVVALNSTGAAARGSVLRFGEWVSDADLNNDGQITADEVRARGAQARERERALVAARCACPRLARARG